MVVQSQALMRHKKINELELRRARILREILSFDLLLPGSYKEVYRKCGKHTCWCSQEETQKGHPLKRLNWKKDGINKTKAIPSEDVNWIKVATANYRKLRSKIKELRASEEKLKELLSSHANELIRKTRTLKDYL